MILWLIHTILKNEIFFTWLDCSCGTSRRGVPVIRWNRTVWSTSSPFAPTSDISTSVINQSGTPCLMVSLMCLVPRTFVIGNIVKYKRKYAMQIGRCTTYRHTYLGWFVGRCFLVGWCCPKIQIRIFSFTIFTIGFQHGK